VHSSTDKPNNQKIFFTIPLIFLTDWSDTMNGAQEVMVVAWRIVRLMRLGRECPDLDAGLLFSRDE
jgi:hypothetical protein